MNRLKLALILLTNVAFAYALYPTLYSTHVIHKALPKVVKLMNGNRLGSGSFITPQGHILTVAHMIVTSTDTVVVETYKGAVYTADVLAIDRKHDLALLKVNETMEHRAPVVRLSQALTLGETVLVIGHPFGFSWTVTKGIVSGLGRDDGLLFQTDSVLNPGNSGGPVLNDRGELIGVADAISPAYPFFTGQGLAIDATHIRAFLERYNLGGVL